MIKFQKNIHSESSQRSSRLEKNSKSAIASADLKSVFANFFCEAKILRLQSKKTGDTLEMFASRNFIPRYQAETLRTTKIPLERDETRIRLNKFSSSESRNKLKVTLKQGNPEKKLSLKLKKFNIRKGDWICLRCENLNFHFRRECNICKSLKIL